MTHRTQLTQPEEAPTLEDLELTVSCPTCHMGPGARCQTRSGKPARESHGRRLEALRDAAGITAYAEKHHRRLLAQGYSVTWTDTTGEQALKEAYAARVRPAPQSDPEPAAPTEAAVEPRQSATPARRQLDHALTALAATTPGRRRYIAAEAERYLAQVERRRRPFGYRRDAFEMRGGATVAAMLGLAIRPSDPQFPATARAIVTAVNAPVDSLVEAARTTGAPAAVALAHILGGTR